MFRFLLLFIIMSQVIQSWILFNFFVCQDFISLLLIHFSYTKFCSWMLFNLSLYMGFIYDLQILYGIFFFLLIFLFLFIYLILLDRQQISTVIDTLTISVYMLKYIIVLRPLGIENSHSTRKEDEEQKQNKVRLSLRYRSLLRIHFLSHS